MITRNAQAAVAKGGGYAISLQTTYVVYRLLECLAQSMATYEQWQAMGLRHGLINHIYQKHGEKKIPEKFPGSD